MKGQWDEMEQLWQTTQPTNIDFARELRKARRRFWYERSWVLPVLVNAGAIAFIPWRWPGLAILGFMFLLTIGGWLFNRAQGTVERANADDGRSFQSELLRHYRWQWKVLRGAWVAIVAAGLFCTGISCVVYLQKAEFYAAEPWRAIVGFGGQALILIGIAASTALRERRLSSRIRELTALDSND